MYKNVQRLNVQNTDDVQKCIKYLMYIMHIFDVISYSL